MKSPHIQRQQGLIGIILLIIIALIILGYFGFSARTIVESPQVQENLGYFWDMVKTLFNQIGDLINTLYNSLADFLSELFSDIANWKP